MKKTLLVSILALALVISCLSVSVSAGTTVYSGLKSGVVLQGSDFGSTDANGNYTIDFGSNGDVSSMAWLTDASGNEMSVKDFTWDFDFSLNDTWCTIRLFFRGTQDWCNGDYCIWINGTANNWGCAGNADGYTDCRISITENDKQGANAVAIKPYSFENNAVYHFKLQVAGNKVTLWVTPAGQEQGEALFDVTIENLPEEGRFKYVGYTHGVYTLANSTVTVGTEDASPDTADYMIPTVAALAVATVGIIFIKKKRS